MRGRQRVHVEALTVGRLAPVKSGAIPRRDARLLTGCCFDLGSGSENARGCDAGQKIRSGFEEHLAFPLLLEAGLPKNVNCDQTALRRRIAGMQQCMPRLWRDEATATLLASVAAEQINAGTVLNPVYLPSKMPLLKSHHFETSDEICTTVSTAKTVNDPLGIQVDDPSCRFPEAVMAAASTNRIRTAAIAEAIATEMARAALHLSERGQATAAEALLRQARHHRIQALQLRAEAGAEQYLKMVGGAGSNGAVLS